MEDRSPPVREKGFHGTKRFRRITRRGAGGMGVVYEVIDTERSLRLALKTLPHVRPRALLRLKHEFRTLRDLSHPNLVQLHELIFEEGLWFFTMELVEGDDLLSYVRPPSEQAGGRVLDEGRLRACLLQLASALRYLHTSNIIHCDVKPSNVMVTAEGRVVVLDFGLAVDVEESFDDAAVLAGTPAYMAPEQIEGGRVTAATDAYALGVLLHEALTGARPFEDPADGGEPEAARTLQRRRVAPRGPPPPLLAMELPADLVSLRTRLLAVDPAERPDDDGILAALGVRPSDRWSGAFALPPGTEDGFVGRVREIAQLRAALGDARKGAFVAAAVEGVSGIGKTTLVRKAVRALEESDGALVLRGRCHERESLPFKAFDGIVDDLVRHLGRSDGGVVDALRGPGMEALAQLFPTVGALGARARGESRGDEQWKDARALAFGTLKGLLGAVAERRPLVLVVDDVHWADGDSVALLSELARPPGPPLLLIVTARPVDGGPSPAVTALGASARRIDVAGLGRAEVLLLVGSHASPGGPPSGTGPQPGPVDVDALLEETEGHPMFVEELLRSAVRRRAKAGGSRVRALDEALRARVATLGEHARRVLEAIAAAGGPTPLVAVREGSGLRVDYFADALRELERQKLARSSGTDERATVEPFHDRVREAVYGALDAATRRAVHERLAWGLEQSGATAEQLVHHFELGDNPSLAGRYATEAAERMEAAFAYDKASAFWSVAVASSPPHAKVRTELLLRQGRALGRAGRPKEAADTFLAAARMDGVTGDQRFDLERRATEQLLCAGYLTEGLALAKKLLGEVGLSVPEGKVAAMASLLWHQWRSRQVPVDLPRDRGLSKEDEAAAARRLDVRWTVGTGLNMVDATRGTAVLAAGLGSALRTGDSLRRARALYSACASEATTGDARRARALAEATRAVAAADGGSLCRAYALLAQAAVAFMADANVAEAIGPLLEAEALWSQEGRDAGWETAVFAQYICWCLWWMGDYGALKARWEGTVRAARLGGHRYLETMLRVAFLQVHLMDDRPRDGTTDAEEALAQWSEDGREDGLFRYWLLEGRTWTWLYEAEAAGGPALWTDWRAFDLSFLSQIRVLRGASADFRVRMAILEAYRAHGDEDPRGRARATANLRRWTTRLAAHRPLSRQTDSGPGALAVQRLLAGDRPGAEPLLRAVVATLSQGKYAVMHAAWSVLLGEVVGGAEGDALRAEALDFFASRGVRRPEAFAHMLVPMRVP